MDSYILKLIKFNPLFPKIEPMVKEENRLQIYLMYAGIFVGLPNSLDVTIRDVRYNLIT